MENPVAKITKYRRLSMSPALDDSERLITTQFSKKIVSYHFVSNQYHKFLGKPFFVSKYVFLHFLAESESDNYDGNLSTIIKSRNHISKTHSIYIYSHWVIRNPASQSTNPCPINNASRKLIVSFCSQEKRIPRDASVCRHYILGLMMVNCSLMKAVRELGLGFSDCLDLIYETMKSQPLYTREQY